MQAAQAPCQQTAGSNPSQWLHNWSCTYHTSNTSGYVTAGHAVGHAGGGAAIGLAVAVALVIIWIAATKRKRKATAS